MAEEPNKTTQEQEQEQEEPYQAHGILAALLDAVLKPGTAYIIRVITHCSFVALLVLLLTVLVLLPRDSPEYIHVVMLFLLTAGLYASVVWFLSTGIADPPKEEDKKDEDKKEDDKKEEDKKEDKNKKDKKDKKDKKKAKKE